MEHRGRRRQTPRRQRKSPQARPVQGRGYPLTAAQNAAAAVERNALKRGRGQEDTEYGRSKLEARQVLHWDWRQVCASGQGAIAGLHQGSGKRNRSRSRMEQVQPRAHDRWLRARMVRQAADAAVKALGWKHPYYCDADHITLNTVGRFLDGCDFYTIDVADSIGQPASADAIGNFVKRHPELVGCIQLEGTNDAFEITREVLRQTARKYLAAVNKAGEVYRTIVNAKGRRQLYPRGFDGRNRQCAEPGRVAYHPGGDRRGRNSSTDHRSQVQRTLQQRRGLRRRRGPV